MIIKSPLCLTEHMHYVDTVSANGRGTHKLQLSFKIIRTFSFNVSKMSRVFNSGNVINYIILYLCSSFCLSPQTGFSLFHCIYFFFFFNLSMLVESEWRCTLVTVKPTLLSFHEMLKYLEMFYKHWLVQNENLSCLKYFVLKKKTSTVCMCVCIYCFLLARFLNGLLLNIFKY